MRKLIAGVGVAVVALVSTGTTSAVATPPTNPNYSNVTATGYTVTDKYLAAGGDGPQSAIGAASLANPTNSNASCDAPGGSAPTLNQGGVCIQLEDGSGGIDEQSVDITLADANFGSNVTGFFQFSDGAGNPVGGSGFFCGDSRLIPVPQIGDIDGGTQGAGVNGAPATAPLYMIVTVGQVIGASGAKGTCGSAGKPGTTGTVTAAFSTAPVPPPTGGGGGGSGGTPTSCVAVTGGAGCGTSGYDLYPSPLAAPCCGNETSMGWDPHTNRALFLNYSQTAQIAFDGSTTPAGAYWQDVSAPGTSLATLDPMMFTDQHTGRSWVSQDLGAGSMAYTDDAGATWTQAAPAHALPSFDHPTIAAGPYSATATLPTGATYPDAVYLCGQDGLKTNNGQVEQCARSDNGGLTWGVGVPVDLTQCVGSVSHLVVGSDGTLYLPNANCGGVAGVFVSHDNALTWALRTDPNLPAGSGADNASLAVDDASNLYLIDNALGVDAGTGAINGTYARVSVSNDGGLTWSLATDVGAPYGIANVEFPMAVGGQTGSAAVAFYGSPTGGDSQQPTFAGAWDLYEAVTTNGGTSWSTVNLTPSKPIQKGEICLQGQACTGSTRNLLDFQGMTADQNGRVLIGYADGCVSSACTSASGGNVGDDSGVLARQVGGPGLRGGTLSGTGGHTVTGHVGPIGGYSATHTYLALGGDAVVACPPIAPGIGGSCFSGFPAGTNVHIAIQDSRGLPVQGSASYKDAAGNAIAGSSFCGQTTVAIPAAATNMYVGVTQVGSLLACGNPGTQGTISVTSA